MTVFQRSAPKAKMGAAMSMLTLASIGCVPFSIAVFGGLAGLIGLQATWVVCGALAFIAPVSAAIALRCPVSWDAAVPAPAAPRPEPDRADEAEPVSAAAKSA